MLKEEISKIADDIEEFEGKEILDENYEKIGVINEVRHTENDLVLLIVKNDQDEKEVRDLEEVRNWFVSFPHDDPVLLEIDYYIN